MVASTLKNYHQPLDIVGNGTSPMSIQYILFSLKLYLVKGKLGNNKNSPIIGL